MLLVVMRRTEGYMGKVNLPERSEILRSWWLPAMAEAMQGDEEDAKAREMLESVRRLKRQ